MKGFFKRYLRIDLSERTFESIQINDELLSTYLGGKGLAAYLLMQYQPANIDPYSSDNPLIIGLGPITDTKIFGSSRYGVYTKSPLTGLFCESYSGGKVPEKISKSGYDAIVITGKAEKLIYLQIGSDTVTFNDADSLRGMDSIETEKRLNSIYGKDSGSIVIGPAGERLIPFSIISNDFWRCAGRAGAGAVMGSKNLKAILFNGNKIRTCANEQGVQDFAKRTFDRCKDMPVTKAYKEKGTPMMVDLLNGANAFPTRYWHLGYFEKHKEINAEAMKTRMDVKPHACARCFMSCGKLSTIKEGLYKGLTVEGPEYETIYAFGGLCMIADIQQITYLNDLCDRLGMDTITTGNLVALAMEASFQGKIGQKIDYGNFEHTVSLIMEIADRRGLGETLSKGIKTASSLLGMEDMAIHVKGLEPAGYDPRRLKGMSLAYATSDRGACHLRSTFYKAELSGMISPETIEGKVPLFIDFEDRLTIMDTLILCRFYRDFYQWDELSEIISLSTGLDFNKKQLSELSLRVNTLIRQYNIREGMKDSDNSIPERFFKEPLKEVKDNLSKEEFQSMMQEYYNSKGWRRTDS